MHKRVLTLTISTLVLLLFFPIGIAATVAFGDEQIELVTLSDSKKELRQLQKDIKYIEKEIANLKVIEEQLGTEEDVIKKQAWAAAGKRKSGRNPTKIKKKEQKVLDALTAKRKERAAVNSQISAKQKQVDSYKRQIAALSNGTIKPTQPIAKAEPKPEPKAKSSSTKKQKALKKEAQNWVGTRYRYGGTTKSGVDCSGLTCQMYKQVYSVNLPRTSSEQHSKSKKVSKSSLKAGDLVFFKIKRSKVNHVGIYLGNNEFVHASSSRGVVISNLKESYYKKYFIGGGRYK